MAMTMAGLVFSSSLHSAANAIQWGVNIHSGGSDPKNVAEKLAERNLKCVRMDLWGSDPKYLAKFKNAAAELNAKGIKIEAVLFSKFSAGQSRHQDYNADFAEVEKSVYDSIKPQIENTKDIMLDYELQNEMSLYKGIKVAGSSGQNANDYDTPAGRLQAAVLRGMSKAIDDVRKSSGLPLRIILGTTDRSFGLLTFMQEQGVLFDVIGYHIYPWEQHKPLDVDPWFGSGGPLGQLALFNKPIRINEFNTGEIYSGGPAYPTKPDYENRADESVTEAGFRSLDKHLKEIMNQTAANVEAVIFYELWDEARKAVPENRFGLYFDEDLQKPKISLLLATSFAGGTLSLAEKDELIKRGIGWNVVKSGNE
ncbi:MAG: hypothetical protein HZC28_14815 [Spirochaetes bacterium]|nr:hypothetical protein [Spirochaetota bacterium]